MAVLSSLLRSILRFAFGGVVDAQEAHIADLNTEIVALEERMALLGADLDATTEGHLQEVSRTTQLLAALDEARREVEALRLEDSHTTALLDDVREQLRVACYHISKHDLPGDSYPVDVIYNDDDSFTESTQRVAISYNPHRAAFDVRAK